MHVDLDRNTIDGRLVPGAIVELAAVLIDGPLPTEQVISRLYGANEPRDARNAVRQLAYRARQRGVPIRGRSIGGGRGHGGEYRIG